MCVGLCFHYGQSLKTQCWLSSSFTIVVIQKERENKIKLNNRRKLHTIQLFFSASEMFYPQSKNKHKHTLTHSFICVLIIVYLIFVRKKFCSTCLSGISAYTPKVGKGRKREKIKPLRQDFMQSKTLRTKCNDAKTCSTHHKHPWIIKSAVDKPQQNTTGKGVCHNYFLSPSLSLLYHNSLFPWWACVQNYVTYSRMRKSGKNNKQDFLERKNEIVPTAKLWLVNRKIWHLSTWAH